MSELPETDSDGLTGPSSHETMPPPVDTALLQQTSSVPVLTLTLAPGSTTGVFANNPHENRQMEFAQYTKKPKGKKTRTINRPSKIMDDPEEEVERLHVKYNLEFESLVGKTLTKVEKMEFCDRLIKLFSYYSKREMDDKADSVLHTVILIGGSVRMMCNVFHIGSGRYYRVKKGDEKKKRGGLNGTQIEPVEEEFMQKFLLSIPKEEGFPCAHQRQKFYLLEAGMTWVAVHQRYSEECVKVGLPVRSDASFNQWRRAAAPHILLKRTAEDICDTCTRLDLILCDTSIPEDMKAIAREAKSVHMDVAIIQRRVLKDFIRKFANQQCGEGSADVVGVENLPDSLDVVEDAPEVVRPLVTACRMLMQCEDFGGNLTLPWYGVARPSVDYFTSNLSFSNFVISNLTENVNHVVGYDERLMGKGADGLCSMRYEYHLSKFEESKGINGPKYEVLFIVMDNCVGQNKSHVSMMFACMLSQLFYKKVVLLYLASGHSHMCPDRVVSALKRSLSRRTGSATSTNIFAPEELIEQFNTVVNVKAVLWDHRDPLRPAFDGWGEMLSAVYKPIPDSAIFTRKHFFEIEDGAVTMRLHALAPTDESFHHRFLPTTALPAARQHFIDCIHGKGTDFDSGVNLRDIKLPRTPNKELSNKKKISIGKKLISVPLRYRSYFPSITECVEAAKSEGEDIPSFEERTEEEQTAFDQAEHIALRHKREMVKEVKAAAAAVERKGGAVKPPPVDVSQKSMLNFLSLSMNNDMLHNSRNLGSLKRRVDETTFGVDVKNAGAKPSPALPPKKTQRTPPPALTTAPPPSIQNTPSRLDFSSLFLESGDEVATSESHPIVRDLLGRSLRKTNVLGFKWQNNSCAFDSVLTILLYLFKHVSETQRGLFELELPDVSRAFRPLLDDSIEVGAHWKQAKQQLLDIVFNSPEAKELVLPPPPARNKVARHRKGVFTCANGMWECLFSYPQLKKGSFFWFKMRNTPTCHTEEAAPAVLFGPLASKIYFPSPTSIMYFSLDNMTNAATVQGMLDKQYGERQLTQRRCRKCNTATMSVTSTAEQLPTVIFVPTIDHLTSLCVDAEVVLFGERYIVFGVVYGNGGVHFRSRFIRRNDVDATVNDTWEYDGMLNGGTCTYAVKCLRVCESVQFPMRLPKDASYRAVCAWYLKV